MPVSPYPYADWILKRAPNWLKRRFGAAYLQAIGLMFDALVEGTIQAVRQRWPSYASPAGVAALGLERRLEQGPRESDANYREKLRNAWTYWRLAGQAYGIQRILNAAGYQAVEVFEAAQVGIAGGVGGWGRFWVVIYNGPWKTPSDGQWSDAGTWGDGGLWDDGISADEVRFISRQIHLFRAKHARCMAVAIQLSGSMFDDSVDFDDTAYFDGASLQWRP